MKYEAVVWINQEGSWTQRGHSTLDRALLAALDFKASAVLSGHRIRGVEIKEYDEKGYTVQ